jgi:hypothetical protein
VIALMNIPIIEWDDMDENSEGKMVRVPYIDIDEVTTELRDREAEYGVKPFLLSPYKGDDQAFNARSASVLWHRLPDWDVFMPIATSSRISLQDFVTATLKAGFQKLVVPYRYGYNGQYRFDQLMQFLHGVYDEETWFHVAGGAPELPDHWPGIWSWSEEEL